MSNNDIGQRERITQNRVVPLFRDQLHYEYLGNWEERLANRNIEEELLKAYLKEQQYDQDIIYRTLYLRVAAPLRVNNEAVRLAVIGKLGWIRRQQERFSQQPRESAREVVSGESHFFLGRRYRLRVIHSEGPVGVVVRNASTLEIHVWPHASVKARRRLLMNWYRQQLKALLPPLIRKWQKRLGVDASEWGIKRMKTKWGTCTVDARRIWINLELAKKSVATIEYVVMHELVHLLVKHHDERFMAIMDKHMPRWRMIRQELNGFPLAHEVWRE